MTDPCGNGVGRLMKDEPVDDAGDQKKKSADTDDLAKRVYKKCTRY